MHEHVVESRVPSGGVELAVREVSAVSADAATVVLVHGFPDTQAVWEPLVRLLHDRHGLSVVTYDVRGAGASTAPPDRAGYRTERLVDDVVAVLDAVRPGGRPAHLVGHDWGSVQLWDAVIAADSDPRLRGRIASFTSIAGPSLDHTAQFARRSDPRARLSQALHSWYVAAFHVPVLPELAFRHLAGPLGAQISRGKGSGSGHVASTFGEDAAHGLELYRANVRRRMRSPGIGRTDVPVLTIVPTRDPFLTPALYDDHASYSARGRRVDVDAGHWVFLEQPELVADLVVDWVREHAD